MKCNLQKNSTIAIAGAGLLGRLLAWRLLEEGHRVTLYDAGSFEQPAAAAHTAAGMISPVSEAIDTEPLMYYVGMASLKLWPKWLAHLNFSMAENKQVRFQQQGSIIIAHPRDHSLLQQYQQDMERQLPQEVNVENIDKRRLQSLESDLADHFQYGLFFSAEAHIDNRQLLRALLTRIQTLGGRCIAQTPVEVQQRNIAINNQTIPYDVVIDCRGVGAQKQWPEVRGVRGEILRVQTNEVHLTRPVRLLHPRYQLYVVPKGNGEYVIGATQIESEDRSPVSVQSALELNSALYTINPAFSEARIIEMRANLRPSLNDNRPKVEWHEGAIRVNGLYRHGYLLAPVVVQQTLSLLKGESDEKSTGDFVSAYAVA